MHVADLRPEAYNALGKTPQVTAAITKATSCWDSIVQARIAENRAGLVVSLNALLQSTTFKSYKMQITQFANGDIDFATTLKSATSTPSAIATAMFKNFEQGNIDALLKQIGRSPAQKNTVNAVKKARGHGPAISNAQKYLSKFKSMC
jgi:hypothetical protein